MSYIEDKTGIDKQTRLTIAKNANKIIDGIVDTNEFLCNLPFEQLKEISKKYVTAKKNGCSPEFIMNSFWETVESQAIMLGKKWEHYRPQVYRE